MVASRPVGGRGYHGVQLVAGGGGVRMQRVGVSASDPHMCSYVPFLRSSFFPTVFDFPVPSATALVLSCLPAPTDTNPPASIATVTPSPTAFFDALMHTDEHIAQPEPIASSSVC